MQVNNHANNKNNMASNRTNDVPRRIDAVNTTDNGECNDTATTRMATRGPLAPPPSPVARALGPTSNNIKCAASIDPSEGSSDGQAVSSDTSRKQRASMADRLSTSLATIAGAARAADASTKKGTEQNVARAGGGSSSSSSSGVRHESSSSGRYGGRGVSMGEPAVVTASALNTSSGDDRYTSGGNSGSNGSGEGNGSGSVPYAHAETIEDTGPFLRHYQRRRPASDRVQARDGYGLPVHVDERLDRRNNNNNAAHAMVVARLPPPQTETTGSSSFFSSSGGSGGSGGDERNGIEDMGPLHWKHHNESAGQLLATSHASMPPTNSNMCQSAFHTHADRKRSNSEAVESFEKPAATLGEKLRAVDSKLSAKRAVQPLLSVKKRAGVRRQLSSGNASGSSDNGDSGSGTEGGYAGSASSIGQQSSSCSSPSVSSSEGEPPKRKQGLNTLHHRRAGKRSSESSLFSDLEASDSGRAATEARFAFHLASRSCSPVSSAFSFSTNGDGSSDELEESRPTAALGVARRKSDKQERSRRKRRLQEETASGKKHSESSCRGPSRSSRDAKRRRTDLGSLLAFQSKIERATGRTAQEAHGKFAVVKTAPPKKLAALKNLKDAPRKKIGAIYGMPPIFSLGCDAMAHCLSYMDPPEIHRLLTMPLSKDWHAIYTQPHDLWRVLCLSDPFKAKFDSNDENDSGDESLVSFPMNSEVEMKHLFGRYRLLYTSFVRCMRYLARIKDDAVHGRPPSLVDYGGAGLSHRPFTSNSSLKGFLAKARGIVVKNKRHREESPLTSGCSTPENVPRGNLSGVANLPLGVSDSDTSSVRKRQRCSSQEKAQKKPAAKVKYGPSALTQRLLGPAKTGEAGNVNLPWSCAIYSIVNWMVAFSDVEGIQTMCLRVLPFLLEDENQRTTAQRAGLTGIVLRGMVLFPESVELHTASFHTIVLLARPLGGREGMLFHSSMVNSSGIFNNGSQGGKNGIAVMLDSMRRFAPEEALQAMSCWSLVNIALAPSQKAVLVKLGGISATANSMMQHPYSAEVQFRALFALINLVIPSVSLSEDNPEARTVLEQLGEVNDTTEKEMLDENVGQIANLVVLAMKNFCSSQTILNRACLVLHNLSLTQDYHTTLLWTPNCYQMLEWCLANYPNDQVLQQSAAGTLHRLQLTLSSDEALRLQFTASIQAQQQLSLEQAHREATLLRDQQGQQQQD